MDYNNATFKRNINNLEIPVEMVIPEPGDGSSAMNIKTYLSYFSHY